MGFPRNKTSLLCVIFLVRTNNWLTEAPYHLTHPAASPRCVCVCVHFAKPFIYYQTHSLIYSLVAVERNYDKSHQYNTYYAYKKSTDENHIKLENFMFSYNIIKHQCVYAHT